MQVFDDHPHDLKSGVDVAELDAQLFIFDDLAYVVVHNDPRQGATGWGLAHWAKAARPPASLVQHA